LYEALDFSEVVLLVLGVGRVDDDPAAPLESIAIRIATVALELRLHREAGDLVLALRLEPHELDPGAELGEVDREARRRVLPPEGVFELGVAAVDPDAVRRRVDRQEER